jgi:hypothetical protein
MLQFFFDGRQQRCFNSLRENRAKAGRAQVTEGKRNEHTPPPKQNYRGRRGDYKVYIETITNQQRHRRASAFIFI